MKFIKKIFTLVVVLIIGLVVTGCKEDPIITLNKQSIVLEVGESETIDVSVEPETKLVWESKNSEIASVDENGKITGVAVGETIVTVKAKKAKIGRAHV